MFKYFLLFFINLFVLGSSFAKDPLATLLAQKKQKTIEKDIAIEDNKHNLSELSNQIQEIDNNHIKTMADFGRRQDQIQDDYSSQEERLSKDLSKANFELKEKEKEEIYGLEELKMGLYCSKCKRTASQIEHDERICFPCHLGKVQGEAIPAPPELIAEKKREFEQKVLEAQKNKEAISLNIERSYSEFIRKKNETESEIEEENRSYNQERQRMQELFNEFQLNGATKINDLQTEINRIDNLISGYYKNKENSWRYNGGGSRD